MSVRLNPAVAADKILRQGHSITSTAEAVGIDRTVLSKCLKGKKRYPAEKIPALAEFLQCPVFELLGPEDPRAAVIELAALYRVTPDEIEAAS